MDSKSVAKSLADELASCDIKLVASFPDNWIYELIETIDHDNRFLHVPVNREESAIGLCSGAYMSGMGSAAIMGASGFMTVIYAITKINFTYEIPLLIFITLRGAFDDFQKYHVSNGLYLRPVIEAINLPFMIIDKPDEIRNVKRAYHHAKNYLRPTVVALTRDLMRGRPA